MIQADYNSKIDTLQSKVDVLRDVIKDKDEALGTLNREIGELQKSYSFLSDETAALKGQIKQNEISLESASKKHNDLVDKTSDLEDHSRIYNLFLWFSRGGFTN